LQEEEHTEAMVAAALAARDVAQLAAAVRVAASLQPPYVSAGVRAAVALKEQLQRFAAVRAALAEAIDRADAASLTAALAAAAEVALDVSEVRQAEGLLSRLRKEAALNAQYARGRVAGDLEAMEAALQVLPELIPVSNADAGVRVALGLGLGLGLGLTQAILGWACPHPLVALGGHTTYLREGSLAGISLSLPNATRRVGGFFGLVCAEYT